MAGKEPDANLYLVPSGSNVDVLVDTGGGLTGSIESRDEFLHSVEEAFRQGWAVLADPAVANTEKRRIYRTLRRYASDERDELLRALEAWRKDSQLTALHVRLRNSLDARVFVCLAALACQTEILAERAGLTKARDHSAEVAWYKALAERDRTRRAAFGNPMFWDTDSILQAAVTALISGDRDFLAYFGASFTKGTAAIRGLGGIARLLEAERVNGRLSSELDTLERLSRESAVNATRGGAVRLRNLDRLKQRVSQRPLTKGRRQHISDLASHFDPLRGVTVCLPSWEVEYIKARGGEYMLPQEFALWQSHIEDEKAKPVSARGRNASGARIEPGGIARYWGRGAELFAPLKPQLAEYARYRDSGLTADEVAAVMDARPKDASSLEWRYQKGVGAAIEAGAADSDYNRRESDIGASDWDEYLANEANNTDGYEFAGVTPDDRAPNEGGFLYEDARRYFFGAEQPVTSIDVDHLIGLVTAEIGEDVAAYVRYRIAGELSEAETMTALKWDRRRYDAARMAWTRGAPDLATRANLSDRPQPMGVSLDSKRKPRVYPFFSDASVTWYRERWADIPRSGTFAHRGVAPNSLPLAQWNGRERQTQNFNGYGAGTPRPPMSLLEWRRQCARGQSRLTHGARTVREGLRPWKPQPAPRNLRLKWGMYRSLEEWRRLSEELSKLPRVERERRLAALWREVPNRGGVWCGPPNWEAWRRELHISSGGLVPEQYVSDGRWTLSTDGSGSLWPSPEPGA